MNWYKKYVFAGLPAYTQNEILQKLKMFGVEYLKEGKGDHAVFINKNNGMISAMPMASGSRIINPVTMKRKMVDAFGIPWRVWADTPKRPKQREIDKIQHLLPWSNKEELAEQNIDLGKPTGEAVEKPYENEPWYIEQKKRDEEARLKDEAETREIEEMIRQEGLGLAENKMNWYKKAKGVPGGLADKKKDTDFNQKELDMGVEVELEHTNDRELSKDIAKDHLEEFPDYYTELKKMEDKLEDK